MYKSTLTMLLFLIAGMAFAQDTKVYTKDNIHFEYPVKWEERHIPGYYILISEPAKKELSVMTTFDVAVSETSDSLEGYCDKYEKDMNNNAYFKEFNVRNKEVITFKGMQAIEYHCTAMVMDIPTEWKSIVFKKEGKIYKLTTTSTIGQFDKNKKITDRIFESFEIESAQPGE